MRSNKLIILCLLVLAIGINYIDRSTLPISKSNIEQEFDLDQFQMGWLLSAFFWSYALFQLPAGWLVDRFNVKWIYAGGFLIWSLSTAAMGFVDGLSAFILFRLTLGIGESVAYPATSKIVTANFDEKNRGLVNSLIDAGSKIGPALSLLVGGLFVAKYDWRALFLTVGLGSLIWLPLWILLIPEHAKADGSSSDGKTAATDEPPTTWDAILSCREVWITSLGMFCLGYVWYFLASWLPGYLEKDRGFTKESMAVFGSLPFWAMAVTAIFGGLLSDALVRWGWEPSRVRKSFLAGGFLLCGLFMTPAVFAESATWCIVFLTAACAALGIYTSNVWAVTQSLAGKRASGKWSGLQNCIGNMGGVVSTPLTGWLAKQTDSLALAFMVCTGVLIAGALLYTFGLKSLDTIDWDAEQPQTRMNNG